MAFLPAALHWDGISFLSRVAREASRDYAHVLYLPLLRAARQATAPLGFSLEASARLVSAVAGALVFVQLWSRFQRRDLGPPLPLAIAALVTTTPFCWLQAGVVEPTTLTVAALLAAASAADAYAATRNPRTLFLLCVAVVLAAGFHGVSLLALPWLVVLARGTGPRPPLHHAAIPLAFLSFLGVLLLVQDDLRPNVTFWSGFLPRPGSWSACAELVGDHAALGYALAVRAAPALSALGLAAAVLLALADRRALVRVGCLAVPFLGVFLLLGKPVVMLLEPVYLSWGLALAAGARVAMRWPWSRVLTHVVVSVALSLQLGFSLRDAVHHAFVPDVKKEAALLLASAAAEPPAVLLAGELAQHLLWYTDAAVVSVPDVIHAAKLAQGRAVDPVEAVLDAARRERESSGRTTYLTSEALEYLEELHGVPRERLVGPDTVVRVVRESPELVLFRLE